MTKQHKYNIRLHEALKPLADGCIASAIKAAWLGHGQNGKYNKDLGGVV